MSFRGKTCVITGAANGIGLCTALEFAKAGSNIAFIDLKKEAGEAALSKIKECGVKGIFHHGDIAQEKVLAQFANEVINTFGAIDCLVNNAFVTRKGLHSGCTSEEFNYVLKIGVIAPYLLAKLFAGHFNEGGSIVNICSTRALMSQSDTESYSAAKGGLLSLTHALAASFSGKVRVNSICPGWIDVNDGNTAVSMQDMLQHPAGRVGKPADIARAIMFLCNPENSFITGQNIIIDGGMTKLMIYNGDEGWKYNV